MQLCFVWLVCTVFGEIACINGIDVKKLELNKQVIGIPYGHSGIE